MSANNSQIGGDHYKTLQPEPWDVIWQWRRDYLVGSAIKYLARWETKGGVDDLRKAVHFIQKRIELAEAEAGATPMDRINAEAAAYRPETQAEARLRRMATVIAEVPRP